VLRPYDRAWVLFGSFDPCPGLRTFSKIALKVFFQRVSESKVWVSFPSPFGRRWSGGVLVIGGTVAPGSTDGLGLVGDNSQTYPQVTATDTITRGSGMYMATTLR
jgi:hypothetical protein